MLTAAETLFAVARRTALLLEMNFLKANVRCERSNHVHHTYLNVEAPLYEAMLYTAVPCTLNVARQSFSLTKKSVLTTISTNAVATTAELPKLR